MTLQRVRAGCGQEADAPAGVREVAYLDLAFEACASCEHRIVPEEARAFCRWLPVDAPSPFASLASLVLGDEDARP